MCSLHSSLAKRCLHILGCVFKVLPCALCNLSVICFGVLKDTFEAVVDVLVTTCCQIQAGVVVVVDAVDVVVVVVVAH